MVYGPTAIARSFPKQTDETGFDSFERIAFETAFRFIRASSGRQSYDCSKNAAELLSHGVSTMA
jgi:hypothetical protein